MGVAVILGLRFDELLASDRRAPGGALRPGSLASLALELVQLPERSLVLTAPALCVLEGFLFPGRAT